MESNAQGDNTTLQHVTIHSDLQHIMWGSLKPKLVNELQYEIKEVKKSDVLSEIKISEPDFLAAFASAEPIFPAPIIAIFII